MCVFVCGVYSIRGVCIRVYFESVYSIRGVCIRVYFESLLYISFGSNQTHAFKHAFKKKGVCFFSYFKFQQYVCIYVDLHVLA